MEKEKNKTTEQTTSERTQEQTTSEQTTSTVAEPTVEEIATFALQALFVSSEMTCKKCALFMDCVVEGLKEGKSAEEIFNPNYRTCCGRWVKIAKEILINKENDPIANKYFKAFRRGDSPTNLFTDGGSDNADD